MSWDFSTSPALQVELDWIRGFIGANEKSFVVYGRPYRELQADIQPLRSTIADHGLWAPHLPKEAGGAGLSWVEMALVYEVLGESLGAQIAFGCAAPDAPNTHTLANARISDAVRQKWFEPLVEGRLTSAFAMTEPDAGSDPSRLTTRAVRGDGGWILRGRKWYITNGAIADFLIAVAVTAPDLSLRPGLSLFVVPADAPGFTVEREIPDMEHPTPLKGEFGLHAQLRFDDVFVPDDHVVGDIGDGARLAQLRLGPARIQHCMRWLGQCNLAYRLMLEHIQNRFVHGSLLSDKQTVRHLLVECHTRIEMARLLVLNTAWKIDQMGAQQARMEISAIKVVVPQVLLFVLDAAVQVHGAKGFSSDTPLERLYRAARASRIFDGPDEVHRDLVARELIRGAAAGVQPLVRAAKRSPSS